MMTCGLLQQTGLRLASIVAVCLYASAANAATSKLHPPDKDHAGSLRVAQVVTLATREEILALGSNLEILLASGLKDSDLVDGSVAAGRVNCCHQKSEESSSIWFYVPPDIKVQDGDLAVVRMGRKASKRDPGEINVAVEIRESADVAESRCIWDPPMSGCGCESVYCDWMPAEGWTAGIRALENLAQAADCGRHSLARQRRSECARSHRSIASTTASELTTPPSSRNAARASGYRMK